MLQQQVDASKRKYSTAEAILKNITQERDSAVSQLVVAYGTVEQLKHENESLKAENGELKARVNHLSNGREGVTQERIAKQDSHHRRAHKRAETVQDIRDETNVQGYGVQQKSVPIIDRHQELSETPGEPAKASVNKDGNAMFDLRSKQYRKGNRAGVLPQNQPNGYLEDSEDSVYEAPTGKTTGKGPAKPSRRLHSAQDDGGSPDLTYLSFVDVRSKNLSLFISK